MKKTILITGSTDGIGKLAAAKFAHEGHTVYLHGRNPQKVADTISEIKEKSGNDEIKGFVSDFSDLERVKEMAALINTELPKIDVLINNAGVFKSNALMHENNIDIRFAVNYLAPYLLTELLMPLIEKGESPRIINLSSAAQSSISLEALSGREELNDQVAYAQSKLALTMWSFYLAGNHKNIGILAVNPGSLLNTKMVKEAYGHHWSSADKGANILYDLAMSEEYNNVSGKYFDNDKGTEKGFFAPAHADAYNSEKVEELIAMTNSILS